MKTKPFIEYCNETRYGWLHAVGWLILSLPLILRGPKGDSTELALLFLALLGTGAAIGSIFLATTSWIRTRAVKVVSLLCYCLLASSAQASDVVSDDMKIARGDVPTIQLNTSPVCVVVVVVAGGATVYCGYYIYRACMRWINSTNMQSRLRAADQASQNYSGGTCLADLGQLPNHIRIHYEAGTLTASSPETIESLPLVYGQSYQRGDGPVAAENSRISFRFDTVSVEPVEHRYLVERSRNMQLWETVIVIEQPGDVFDLEDSFVESAMFYRVMEIIENVEVVK